MAIAGRVAIVPKGEWSQSVTYDKLDLVTHNGNTFIAYKSSVGVEPVDGDTWMLVMQGIDPQDIENIIDGTTTVGNANKLGGKSASDFTQQFAFGVSGETEYYSIFARCSNNDPVSYTNATVLFTEGGNFGSAFTGVWLIQISGRNATPTMTIRTLIDSVDGSRPQFGYYNDTANGYLYFGVKSTAYRGVSTVTNLGGSAFVEIKNFGSVTTEPSGWTKASAPVVATTADLANYFNRMTGDTIYGNSYVKSDGNDSRQFGVENAVNYLHMGVTSDGAVYLQDKNSNIVTKYANGATYFEGTASGNLPLSGGVLNDNLQINTERSVPFIINRTTDGYAEAYHKYYVNGAELGGFGYYGANTPVALLTGGQASPLIHANNVANYAMTAAGGTFTGAVGFAQEIHVNGSATLNGTTSVNAQFYANGIRATEGLTTKNFSVDAGGSATIGGNDILHTGNKPTGSYTGNGDATDRAISTGGYGNVIHITSSKGGCIIANVSGAFIIASSITRLTFNECNFVGGVLTLRSNNEMVNASGLTYTYQVL